MRIAKRALIAGVAAVFAVAGAAPANAILSATIQGPEGCDAYAIRDYTWTKTGRTSYDPCSLQGVSAKIQPVGGAAYTTKMKWGSGDVYVTAPSGMLTYSWHAAKD